jgi:hypothetical protein
MYIFCMIIHKYFEPVVIGNSYNRTGNSIFELEMHIAYQTNLNVFLTVLSISFTIDSSFFSKVFILNSIWEKNFQGYYTQLTSFNWYNTYTIRLSIWENFKGVRCEILRIPYKLCCFKVFNIVFLKEHEDCKQ